MAISLARNGPTPLATAKSYARISQVLDIPNLIQSQIQSFQWFHIEGLAEVYQEISPIQDYTGNKYELYFLDHYFRPAKYSRTSAKRRRLLTPLPSMLRPGWS